MALKYYNYQKFRKKDGLPYGYQSQSEEMSRDSQYEAWKNSQTESEGEDRLSIAELRKAKNDPSMQRLLNSDAYKNKQKEYSQRAIELAKEKANAGDDRTTATPTKGPYTKSINGGLGITFDASKQGMNTASNGADIDYTTVNKNDTEKGWKGLGNTSAGKRILGNGVTQEQSIKHANEVIAPYQNNQKAMDILDEYVKREDEQTKTGLLNFQSIGTYSGVFDKLANAFIEETGVSMDEFRKISDNYAQLKHASQREEQQEEYKDMSNTERIAKSVVNAPLGWIGSYQGLVGAMQQSSDPELGRDYNSQFFNISNKNQDLRNAENEVIDTIENPVLRTLAHFGYNAPIMGIESASSALAGEAGLASFAAGGYTTGLQDAEQRGLSGSQAQAYAAAVGSLEYFTERIPWEGMRNIWSGNAVNKDVLTGSLKPYIKAFLKQAGEEAGEEVVNGIGETIADGIISGDRSNLNLNIKAYMENEGLSEEEATRKAIWDIVKDTADAAITAGLSAGMSVGPALAGQAYSETKAGRNIIKDSDAFVGDTESSEYIPETRESYLADEDYNQAIATRNAIMEAAQKAAENKKVSGKQARSILENTLKTQENLQSSRRVDFQKKLEQTKKETEDRVINDVKKASTPSELETIKESYAKNENIVAAVEEKEEAMVATGEATKADFSEAITPSKAREIAKSGKEISNEKLNSLPEEVQKAYQLGYDEKAHEVTKEITNRDATTIAVKSNGKTKIEQIKSVSANGNELVFETESGAKIPASEATFTDKGKYLFNGEKGIRSLDNPVLAQMAIDIEASSPHGISIANVTTPLKNMFTAGQTGIDFEAALKGLNIYAENISKEDLKKAYEEGKKQLKAKDRATTKVRKGRGLIVEQTEDNESSYKAQFRDKKGNISEAVQSKFESEVTETEKKFLEMFSKKIGVDIRFIDSDTANRGEYKPSEGAIYLNLNNGINMFEVALHEGIGEFMAASNEKAYNQIVDSVLNAYAAMNSNKLASDIRAYQKAYKGDMYGDSARGASRELFNDALGEILSSESNLKKMFDWMVANEGEAQANKVKKTLVDYFKDIVDMIKSIKNLGGLSRLERNKMRLSEEQANKYADMIFKAMDEAIANRDAAVENNNISPENYERSSKYVDTDKTKDIHANTELYLSDNDIDAYLAVGSQAHKQKVKNYRNGKQVILRTEKELNEFVEEAIKGNRQDTVAYGRLSDVLSQKIMDAANDRGIFISIENYYVALVGNDLYHSYKNHAEPKQEGDLPMSYDELLYAIKNINTAEVDFITETKNKTQTAYLSFDMGDGVVEMLEVVSTGNGTLNFKNAWKQTYEKHKKYKSTKDVARGRTSKIARASDAFLDSSLTRTKDNSTDNLSKNSEESVNNARKSISVDTNGRELSEGQKEYFADSKVVDEDGKLKVVFHGTEEEFNEFKANDFLSEANGASQIKGYFSEDEEYAERYGNTKAYYLNITNPLIMDGDAKTLDEWTKFFAKNGINNVIFDSSVTGVNGSKDTLKGANSNGKVYYAFYEIFDTENIWHGDGNVTEKIAAAGYDGIQTNDEYEKAWIPFDSKQIKRTDNLNPTNDSDIRYSKKLGEIEQVDTNGRELSEGQKEYFADSKVVDEDGKLKVVYHGTQEDFYEFKPREKGGKNAREEGYGIYFAENQAITNMYGDRQLEGYLNITKPAYSNRKTIKTNDLAKLIKATCEAEARLLMEDGGYNSLDEAIKDTWVSNLVDTYSSSMQQVYKEAAETELGYADNDKDIIHVIMNDVGVHNYKDAYDFYEILTATLGFDGLITDWESSDGEINTVYIAFNSNQFKNADNLNPTEDSDIRYSKKIDLEYDNAFKANDTDKMQQLVEQAAREAGYNSPLLYHGTQKFGFTEFDLNKMDDKQTIFLTSNNNIASTYSGTTQNKAISESFGDIDAIPDDKLADALNSVSPDDGMKGEYEYYDQAKIDSLKRETISGIKDLFRLVDTLINTVEDEKGLKALKKIREIEMLTSAEQVMEDQTVKKDLSTALYMLLNHTEVLSKSGEWTTNNDYVLENPEKWSNLEHNIRKAYALLHDRNTADNTFIVESYLDGYAFDVWTPTEARMDLKKNVGKGNYSLYAKLGNSLVIDAKGKNWNSLDNWTRAYTDQFNISNTEAEIYEGRVYLLSNDGEILLNFEASDFHKSMTPEELHSHLINTLPALFETDKVKVADLTTTRDIAKFAKDRGYDSVVIKNVRDNGGRNHKIDYDELADIYLLFNPNDAKSADPVTYDDNGDVIPLSERFNTEDNDLRYSKKVTLSDGREVDYLADVLTPTEYNRLKEMIDSGYPAFNSSDGDAVYRLDNKLVYARGKENFGISRIIEANVANDFDANKILDTVTDSEIGDIYDRDEQREFITGYYGSEAFKEYTNADFGKTSRFDRPTKRGKGRSDAYYAQREQNRRRVYIKDGKTVGEDIRKSIRVDWDKHNNYEVPARTYEDTIFFLGTDEEIEAAEKQDITVKAYIANIIHSKDFKGLMFTDTIGDQRFLTRSTREGYDWQLSQGRDGEPIGHDSYTNDNDDITSYDTWPKQTLAALYNEILNELPKEGSKIHVVREGIAEEGRKSVAVFGESSPYSETLKQTEYVSQVLSTLNNQLKGTAVSMSYLNNTVEYILDKYKADLNPEEFTMELAQFIAYMTKSEQVDYSEMMNYLMNIGDEVIKASQLKDPESERVYNELKKELTSNKIRLSETQKKELTYKYGSWKTVFAKLNQAGIKLDNKVGRTLDAGLYQEISESFRKIAGVYLNEETVAAEQIATIIDAMEAMEPSSYQWEGASDLDKALDVATTIIDRYYSMATSIKESNIVKGTEKGNAAVERAKQAEIKRLRAKQAEWKGKLNEEFAALVEDKKKMIQEQQEFYRKQAEIERKFRGKEREFNRKADMSEKELSKTAKVLAKMEYQGLKDTEAKRKNKENIVNTCTRLVNWMNKPTDARHVPTFLKPALSEMIKSIDFMPASMRKGNDGTISAKKWQETMRKLQQVLNDIKTDSQESQDDSDKYNLSLVLDAEDLVVKMEDLLRKNNGIADISKMSKEDLKVLSDIMKSISKGISQMNENFMNQRFKTVTELSLTAMDEMEALKPIADSENIVKSRAQDFLNIDMLEPITFFEELGDATSSIMQEFFDGEKTGINIIREADEFFENLAEDMGLKTSDIRKWEKDVKDYKVDGGIIQLTPADIMSLYCSYKREELQQQERPSEATHHIAAGGIKGYRQRIGFKEVNRRPKALHGTQGEILEIINTLTTEQMEYADRVVEYMSTTLAAHGNETSNKISGYSKYLGKYYFPIKTDNNTIATNESNNMSDNAAFTRFIHASFTKAQLDRADNALVVMNFFDVVTEHITGMSNYCAYAMPLSDALRFYNFSTTRRNGTEVEGEYLRNTQTIKDRIERAKGSEAKKYFETFLRDVNLDNKPQGSTASKLISQGLTGLAKAKAVGLNIRVILQQPTAIIRAADVIEGKYLMQGWAKMSSNPMKAVKYAQKKSYLCYWKSKGLSDTRVSQGMKEIITGQETVRQDIVEKTGIAAGVADDITWASMYYAAENKVKDTTNLTEGSAEFDAKVEEIFSDIINNTQVIDSNLRKTGTMRSQDAIEKLANAFKKEPQKTYNMLHRSLHNLDQAKYIGDKEAIKEAEKKWYHTLKIFLETSFVTALAQSLVDAWRDDDEEKYWTKFLQKLLPYEALEAIKSFGEDEDKTIKDVWTLMQGVWGGSGNVVDNADIFSSIPFVADFDSLLKGYSVSRLDSTSILTQLSNTITTLGSSNATWYKMTYSVAELLGYATGIGVGNLLKDMRGIYNQFMAPYTGYYVEKTTTDESKRKKANQKKAFTEAYESGNVQELKNQMQTIYDEAIESGKDESAAWSSVRTTLLKEEYLSQIAKRPDDVASINNRFTSLVTYTKHKQNGEYINYTEEKARKVIDKWYESTK